MPKIDRVSDAISDINRRGASLMSPDDVTARVSRARVWMLGISNDSARGTGYVATTARAAMADIGHILGAGDHAPRTLRGQLRRYGTCRTLTGYNLTLRRMTIREILA